MARNKNGCSKVSSSLTSTSKMSLAKTFNVAVMSNYHQYCSLPKEIRNLLSFTEFMGVPEADDNGVSTSSFQQQKEREILNDNKEVIGPKLEEIIIRGQTIRDVGNVTPRCEAYSKICNSNSNYEVTFISNGGNDVDDGIQLKNGMTSLVCRQTDFESHRSQVEDFFESVLSKHVKNQDVASFGQEENNDLYSIFGGTHGASMGRDDGNGTSHHKPDFVYFGVDDIKHCQRLNKYWLELCKQRYLLPKQDVSKESKNAIIR